MKFKVIFDIDTESENGSSAYCSVIDEDCEKIAKLPKKEMIALAFHLSAGASNLLKRVFNYMEQ